MTARTKTNWIVIKVVLLFIFLIANTTYAGLLSSSQQRQARQILDASGIKGGLIVHIGCGDGRSKAI
jgi:hypothetical protein